MKKIRRLIIGIVLLVAAVAGGGWYYINHLAKAGVEKGATYALGVDTTLDGINVGLLSGEVGMNKLHVANPSGFDKDHFLQFGDGEVEVSLGSLLEDRVVVPRLVIDDISMNIERKVIQANYEVILENLKRLSSSDESAAPGGGKKFVINNLVLNDIVITLTIGTLELPVKIPKIELANVGQAENGVIIAQLTGILVSALIEALVENAGMLLPADMLADLNGALAQLDELHATGMKVVGDVTAMVDGQVKDITKLSTAAIADVQKSIQQTTGQLQQVGDSARKSFEDAGKSLQEGFGGVLSGKKDEKKR